MRVNEAGCRLFEPVARRAGAAEDRRASGALDRSGRAALALVLLVLVVSLGAPLLAPHGRDAIDLGGILAAPSPAHPLGTDELGRDVLSRLLYAGRFSMLVALCAVAVATGAGMLAGAAAGYLGGGADAAITLIMDLVLSVPVFLVLLVVAAAGGGRLWLIPLVIGAVSWVETARIVRSLVYSLRERGFVEAALAAGASRTRILARHILPETLPAVTVAAAAGFAQAMLAESAISFLGFGVQPPVPTWGTMLQNAQIFIRQAPLAAFAPGFMIFAVCLAFSTLARSLRAGLAIDPRSR